MSPLEEVEVLLDLLEEVEVPILDLLVVVVLQVEVVVCIFPKYV